MYTRRLVQTVTLASAFVMLTTADLSDVRGHGDPGEPGAVSPDDEFPYLRTHLESWLMVSDFGGDATSGNDIWGYVSPSGREYVLMGLNTVTAIVDITDPHEPVIIAEIGHPPSIWSDIKTYSHYAYVMNETGGGLQIIDLAEVDDGIVTELGWMPWGGIETAHNLAIDESSGYLYLVGSNWSEGGLVAVDLRDPASPVVVGAFDDNYVHDAQIITYFPDPEARDESPREIAFAFAGRDGFQIIDFTDKQAPVVLSTTAYSGLSYCHQGWVDVKHELLYINDELDERDELVPTTTTRIFDISDFSHPRLVGTFSSGLESIDHNLIVTGGFIYEANYSSGLRIFDARLDPTAPTNAGYFDTFPPNDETAFDGAWGIYPLFPSGTVAVSDYDRGLFIIDVDQAREAPPEPFELSLPVLEAQLPPDAVRLEWTPSFAAQAYTVTLAWDKQMTQIVRTYGVDGQETTLSLGGLDPCADYFWHVEAHNLNGETLVENGPLMFSTLWAPPTPSGDDTGVSGLSTSDGESELIEVEPPGPRERRRRCF